jgi:S1-C subfamily serine protease
MVRSIRRLRVYGLPLALALGVLLTPSPALSQAKPRAAAPSAADLNSALQTTARTTAPAVVQIFTTSYSAGDGIVPRPAELITTERASGSGVIVDPDGYIVTNVVKGAERVRVELPLPGAGQSILSARSRTVMGRVVGIDLETDLAVVREERNLAALTFGDSGAAGQPDRAGRWQSARLPQLGVARRGERHRAAARTGVADDLRTDRRLDQSGSSGGPLSIASTSSRRRFATRASPCWSSLRRRATSRARCTSRSASPAACDAVIGVRPQTVTPLLATALGLARDDGVILADVRPGPGAWASSPAIWWCAGRGRGEQPPALVNLYRRFVGDVVMLDILRDGKPMQVPVAMTERDDQLSQLASTIRGHALGAARHPRRRPDQGHRRDPPRRACERGRGRVNGRRAFDARAGGLAQGDVSTPSTANPSRASPTCGR